MTDDYREDDEEEEEEDDEEDEDEDDDRDDDEEVLQCWLPGRLHGSTTRRAEIQRFLELGQAEPLQCISARIWSVPYGWGQQPGQPPGQPQARPSRTAAASRRRRHRHPASGAHRAWGGAAPGRCRSPAAPRPIRRALLEPALHHRDLLHAGQVTELNAALDRVIVEHGSAAEPVQFPLRRSAHYPTNKALGHLTKRIGFHPDRAREVISTK